MNKLTTTEMHKIIGGAISATLLSSIIRGITSLFDFGRALGSASRRAKSGKICPL